MNCKKVKRLFPLFIGSEVSQAKIAAIEFHLEKCSKCRQEYNSSVLSHKKVKEWLAVDSQEWEDREWQEVVRKAQKKDFSRAPSLAPWPFKRAWAYALMAVFAVVLTFFMVRPSLIREEVSPEPEMLAQSQQEIISLTMVSKETGLKITWFFNKNFEFKEEK